MSDIAGHAWSGRLWCSTMFNCLRLQFKCAWLWCNLRKILLVVFILLWSGYTQSLRRSHTKNLTANTTILYYMNYIKVNILLMILMEALERVFSKIPHWCQCNLWNAAEWYDSVKYCFLPGLGWQRCSSDCDVPTKSDLRCSPDARVCGWFWFAEGGERD